VHTVLDRREAITAAVQAAGERDVVLVVGRGHEQTLTDDGAPVHLDDAEVAREALESVSELVTERAS
jgi:UDP-N-acetylmuramoyl-L-alanyl-D-glutamate--2,6-diaminopimelate ligase